MEKQTKESEGDEVKQTKCREKGGWSRRDGMWGEGETVPRERAFNCKCIAVAIETREGNGEMRKLHYHSDVAADRTVTYLPSSSASSCGRENLRW